MHIHTLEQEQDGWGPEILKALADRLVAATELPGAGTGELTGRQAVAATIVLARCLAGVDDPARRGESVRDVLRGPDWTWLRAVATNTGTPGSTTGTPGSTTGMGKDPPLVKIRQKLPKYVTLAQAKQCATFLAENISDARAGPFREKLKFGSKTGVTGNVGLPHCCVAMCQHCYSISFDTSDGKSVTGGVIHQAQWKQHLTRSGTHQEKLSAAQSVRAQALVAKETAAARKKMAARGMRKHARQAHQLARVLNAEYRSESEKLAALEEAAENTVMRFREPWSTILQQGGIPTEMSDSEDEDPGGVTAGERTLKPLKRPRAAAMHGEEDTGTNGASATAAREDAESGDDGETYSIHKRQALGSL